MASQCYSYRLSRNHKKKKRHFGEDEINTKITSEPQKEVAKEEPKKTEDKTEDSSKVQPEEKKSTHMASPRDVSQPM